MRPLRPKSGLSDPKSSFSDPKPRLSDPKSDLSDPKSGLSAFQTSPLKPEKIVLCGIIGHWPLRDRCPSHYLIPTYTNLGASGTADHVTLLRLLFSSLASYTDNLACMTRFRVSFYSCMWVPSTHEAQLRVKHDESACVAWNIYVRYINSHDTKSLCKMTRVLV